MGQEEPPCDYLQSHIAASISKKIQTNQASGGGELSRWKPFIGKVAW